MEVMDGYQSISGVTTARESQVKMDATNKRKDYSSFWVVGDKISVFYPIVWSKYLKGGEPVMVQEVDEMGKPVFVKTTELIRDEVTGDIIEEREVEAPLMVEEGRWDIVVYNQWGHPVGDMKATPLKTSFIPSLTEAIGGRPVKFIRDEHGNIQYDAVTNEPLYEEIEGDITYQFSKIAPLFIRGQKQRELNKVYEHNYGSAEMQRQALAMIDEKYDPKKSFDAPKALIGPMRLFTATEVVAVKIDKYDMPDPATAAPFIFRLSDERITELQTLLSDVKFRPRNHEQNWFEVQYTYIGNGNTQADRAAAGRKAHPVGLMSNFTMEKRSPEAFEKIKDRLAKLPSRSSTIAGHCYQSTRFPENQIKAAIENYIIRSSEDLDAVESDKDLDIIARNAYTLVQFKTLDNLSSESICAKIREGYNEYMAKHPEATPVIKMATEETGYEDPDMDSMPTTEELLKGDKSLALGEDSTMFV